ncbi:MAG: hypothetical protein PHF56_15675 [Desulfuromonadaceae bacterium]|nr:hypothetical protein [Desulfuromonadaceae bacterium]
MLTVRSAQIQAFECAGWKQFENEMVIHSQAFSPVLCGVLGEEQLREAVQQAIKRALGYEFTKRGPIRLVIEMMFMFGSHFDVDPQYPQFSDILNTDGEQMFRAEQLYEMVTEYMQKVAGRDNINARRALEKLSSFARKQMQISADGFEVGMLEEMNRAFPQKVAFIGKEPLTKLFQRGQAEARKYGFTSVREDVLIATLMFAFGCGSTDDPLYPWISRTLKDEKIIDATARSERLEKKALTWLDHVLARPREGA